MRAERSPTVVARRSTDVGRGARRVARDVDTPIGDAVAGARAGAPSTSRAVRVDTSLRATWSGVSGGRGRIFFDRREFFSRRAIRRTTRRRLLDGDRVAQGFAPTGGKFTRGAQRIILAEGETEEAQRPGAIARRVRIDGETEP